MRFAHVKRILKLDRLRPRGLSGAKDEVLLNATAQNLRCPRQVRVPLATTGASPLYRVGLLSYPPIACSDGAVEKPQGQQCSNPVEP